MTPKTPTKPGQYSEYVGLRLSHSIQVGVNLSLVCNGMTFLFLLDAS
jgi:hypothetical protein